MFIKLNLPRPSDTIVKEIYRNVDASSLDLNLKKRHDYIQNFTVNSVSRRFIEDDEFFNDLVQKEYSQYFDEQFFPSIGIVTNVIPDQVACWPPHTDRVRIFALNYYLEEGGTNVETVMYNTFDSYVPGEGTGKIFKYSDLTPEKRYHLNMNEWYGLNVRQCHSVENILSRRIIFTISFHDFTIFDFMEKYKHFVVSEENFILG